MRVDDADGVRTVTFDRPEAKNAFTVDETVETLAAQPTETLALAKEAIHANLGRSWADGLEREAHAQTLAYDTDAHEEGVAAFLEKRRPEFE